MATGVFTAPPIDPLDLMQRRHKPNIQSRVASLIGGAPFAGSGIRICGERHLINFAKNLRRLRRQSDFIRGNQQARQSYGEQSQRPDLISIKKRV
jgi:hypothetical protein